MLIGNPVMYGMDVSLHTDRARIHGEHGMERIDKGIWYIRICGRRRGHCGRIRVFKGRARPPPLSLLVLEFTSKQFHGISLSATLTRNHRFLFHGRNTSRLTTQPTASTHSPSLSPPLHSHGRSNRFRQRVGYYQSSSPGGHRGLQNITEDIQGAKG